MRIAAAALRTFYNGMLGQNWSLFEFVRSPDRRRLPMVLTRGQVRVLLGRVRNPRFRALFTLIYGCGLRVSRVLREGKQMNSTRGNQIAKPIGFTLQSQAFHTGLPAPKRV